MARCNMAEIAPERPNPSHASQVSKDRQMLGMQAIEQGNRTIKKDIVASGDDQKALVRR